MSLGLLWTPCVGPIMASVIALAATGGTTKASILITLSYSLGTAIPMFIILQTGRSLLNKIPLLYKNIILIQKMFGIIMVLTAAGLFLNLDLKFQKYLLEKFPEFGVITNIENNNTVKNQLNTLTNIKDNFTPVAPELIPGGQFFNSPPITLDSLKGKVVLVDFWTYTCINCLRTLPYL